MSVKETISNESEIIDFKENQFADFEDSNNLQVIIHDLEKNLDSPEKKNFLRVLSNDYDLNSSKSPGFLSPILTEDLLIDENIDFLMCENEELENLGCESVSVSMNYTKSAVESPCSSIFQSFAELNLLVNSMPQSICESISMQRRSFESQYGKKFLLRIPSFKDFQVKCDKEHLIVEEMPGESEWCSENGLKRSVAETNDVGLSGRQDEICIDSKGNYCTCVWCVLF